MERKKPTDAERIRLAPINASDEVRGLGVGMMHEGYDNTRPPAAADLTPSGPWSQIDQAPRLQGVALAVRL